MRRTNWNRQAVQAGDEGGVAVTVGGAAGKLLAVAAGVDLVALGVAGGEGWGGHDGGGSEGQSDDSLGEHFEDGLAVKACVGRRVR